MFDVWCALSFTLSKMFKTYELSWCLWDILLNSVRLCPLWVGSLCESWPATWRDLLFIDNPLTLRTCMTHFPLTRTCILFSHLYHKLPQVGNLDPCLPFPPTLCLRAVQAWWLWARWSVSYIRGNHGNHPLIAVNFFLVILPEKNLGTKVDIDVHTQLDIAFLFLLGIQWVQASTPPAPKTDSHQ